jgi:glycosyltransferase involved in cell wall biosynthesis
VGVEGLEDLVGRGVVVADDPAPMAERIAELLADRDRASALGAQGRAAVGSSYAWDVTLAPLMTALGLPA